MLIHKTTKAIEEQYGRERENWMGDAVYHIDTSTEEGKAFAEKIWLYHPCYDFVLDDAGNLVDVTPTERPAPEPPPPTELETLHAKLDFLAMMTGYEEVLTV